MRKPLLLSVVGYSNSGKTAFAKEIIRKLKERGYRVGYIKHDLKGHGVTDKYGSDTFRIKPYSDRTALFSPEYVTIWERNVYNIKEFSYIYFKDCDIVIIEGFKNIRGIPKIALGEVEAEDILLRAREGMRTDDIINIIERLRNDKGCSS